jgi:hypothetical protein
MITSSPGPFSKIGAFPILEKGRLRILIETASLWLREGVYG